MINDNVEERVQQEDAIRLKTSRIETNRLQESINQSIEHSTINQQTFQSIKQPINHTTIELDKSLR